MGARRASSRQRPGQLAPPLGSSPTPPPSSLLFCRRHRRLPPPPPSPPPPPRPAPRARGQPRLPSGPSAAPARPQRTPRLMPDKESMYYPRVQHYRELLDSLPMDAYTHGCILHPELTVDSMIPAYATTRIRSQIGNTESELKKLAEENPDLQEAYIAKQKRLKSKLLDHDNVKYLKKILDELEKVLDQVETELQRRNEETPEEGQQPWLCGESFTLADVSLAVTLHRLKFLGFARRNWGNGKRPNLETYYERVLKRKTFNKVLGHVNNILISAVLPTAFRVAKKRAPKVLGTTLVVGLLAGVGYFAFMLFRKRLGSMILPFRPRPNYF
nr:ganglioside-induced differentiation-associated protein 1 isoform X2 [Symphalangus syndactylus]